MFVFPLELCVKCYAFVFKSELSRPSHIPYHITVVITNLKKKNLLRIKTSAVSLLSLTLRLNKNGFSRQDAEGFSTTVLKKLCKRIKI